MMEALQPYIDQIKEWAATPYAGLGISGFAGLVFGFLLRGGAKAVKRDNQALRKALNEAEAQAAATRVRMHAMQTAEATPGPGPVAPSDDVAALEDQNRALTIQARIQKARIAFLEEAMRRAPDRQTIHEPTTDLASAASPDVAWLQGRVAWLERKLQTIPGALGEPEDNRAMAESPAPMAPAPVESVVDDLARRRADWRMRYLEARVAHLEGQAKLRSLGGESGQELGAPMEVEPHQGETARLKWRLRYLEVRNQHLEQLVAKPMVASEPETIIVDPLPTDAAQSDQPIEKTSQEVAASEPLEPPAAEPAPEPVITAAPPEFVQPNEPVGLLKRPPALSAPLNGVADPLGEIEGVSDEVQSQLHALGVFHFAQIARWNEAEAAWVDLFLRARGQVIEQDWTGQAQRLVEAAADKASK